MCSDTLRCKKSTILFAVLLLFMLTFPVHAAKSRNSPDCVWPTGKSWKWYDAHEWLSGCNFQPSTAINQVEMWSGDTFDAATIDKELGWAEELGFNTMRVFLSSVVWNDDAAGFKKRINTFLEICQRHKIKPMFVFFDDCWNQETPKGKQPAPRPGVHNSGWVQDPACSLRADTAALFPALEKYVKDIVGTFKNDDRVLMWDLYNEPGNSGHGIASVPLLKKVFQWARAEHPSQPLTSGIWFFEYPELNAFQLQNSDVITYHNYNDESNHKIWIGFLESYSRPMICTEYMARRNNSRFANIMPMLKQKNIGAVNWGFVSGKTNTIFAWDDPRPDEKEPTLWFHDIYRRDKTPFDPQEIKTIRQTTGKDSEVKLISTDKFDKVIDGKKVSLYTLKNNRGMVAQITNYGGRVVTLWVPDKENNFRDVVTGFGSIDEYQKTHEVYFGALIGRYGNRIAKGEFSLNGKKYSLSVNDGKNHLHGGATGFQNKVWNARPFKNERNEDALELTCLSPDGEGGYPGNLKVTVVYTLTRDNELKIEYKATTDKPTVVNLTHHSFFNLHGFSGGVSKTINTHIVKINALSYTPTDEGLIPTGVIAPVSGTPLDFTRPAEIGARVNEPFADLLNGKGYDHNWILNKHGDKITEAAVVTEPESGIRMRVITDQPALQFYGGNFLNGTEKGKYGEVYTHRTSFAMETQHYPDSPNHPQFPSTTLNPGDVYSHLCIYKFEVDK